jgi:dipeptidase E
MGGGNHFDRRTMLRMGAIGAFGSMLHPSPAVAADPPADKRRLFICGGFLLASDRFRRYMLSLTGKAEPRVCLLATAEGDLSSRIVEWYELMGELPCRPYHLRLFDTPSRVKDFEKYLLSMDAIYVGGGNTLNMLAVWKAHKIDAVLRRAWEAGVLLSGESAGMICWYEQGVTDSRPDQLTAMECLGWLKGSACPHFSSPMRRTAYHRLLASGEVKNGIGCDNSAALLYEGERLVKVVSSRERVGAYAVTLESGKAAEKPFEVELLADKK